MNEKPYSVTSEKRIGLFMDFIRELDVSPYKYRQNVIDLTQDAIDRKLDIFGLRFASADKTVGDYKKVAQFSYKIGLENRAIIHGVVFPHMYIHIHGEVFNPEDYWVSNVPTIEVGQHNAGRLVNNHPHYDNPYFCLGVDLGGVFVDNPRNVIPMAISGVCSLGPDRLYMFMDDHVPDDELERFEKAYREKHKQYYGD